MHPAAVYYFLRKPCSKLWIGAELTTGGDAASSCILLVKSSAMFHHCSKFTIAGGNFTVLERPRSPPSDFRSVRLGDLNLLTQMGNEETLTSDVVERRGPGFVQRKAVVGTRKWKAEVESYQSLRLPFVPQLFGITKSHGVNVLIYHDACQYDSTKSKKARDHAPPVPSSSPSTIVFLLKACDCPRGPLGFPSSFPRLELSKLDPRVEPWIAFTPSIMVTNITAGDSGWTRHLASWNLGSPIATGVKLDDLVLLDTVELLMWLQFPKQNSDPPSNMPYLFVFQPVPRIKEDGTVWIDILPPTKHCYWSFDPLGEEQLREDLAPQLSLPQVTFEVKVGGWSWTTSQYDLLRKFHEARVLITTSEPTSLCSIQLNAIHRYTQSSRVIVATYFENIDWIHVTGLSR
ncbi:hypothetical protein B0H17DRAFT_1136158 [Mycena rosella]|uniref:Uncharacterized protein n=1 Tax=Mycena rosella TaxID=1033263 RepID=A0AAD7DBA8_MYCRO|nr:hypothetical protein B0H17DRAFT_1136158 [Mycena rosella]